MRIGACQRGAVQVAKSRIIVDTQKIRQHGLIHFLGKCLSLGFPSLAMAFQSMSQHFVEEYGRRAAGKKGGTIEGLRQRSCPQGFQVGRHLVFF